MFGATPSTACWRSPKRRGPSSSASTIRSVHLSPTRRRASESGVGVTLRRLLPAHLYGAHLQVASNFVGGWAHGGSRGSDADGAGGGFLRRPVGRGAWTRMGARV